MYYLLQKSKNQVKRVMVLFLSLSQDRMFLLKTDSMLFDKNIFSNVTKPNYFFCYGLFYFQNRKVNIYISIRKFFCCEEGFPIHRFKDVQARNDHYNNSDCPLEYKHYRISLRGGLKADLLEDI